MSDFRLKVFYAVAKNLSFTKASQELFVSQPAITKHIHELESLYQVRLFNRLGNKISLTEAGRVLLEYSERILAEYRRLDYSMHLLHNEYSGQLRLGASTTIAQYVLPPILAEYTRQYPKIKLTLIETNSRNVEQALQEHSIDLGMVEGVFRLPNLRYEAFLCDELVPVSSIQEGGEPEEEISFEEFRQIPLILRERGSGTLDAIEAVLAEKGVKLSSLNVRMHLGSTEGIKSFLKHSHCLGIVSIFAIRRELEENVFRITDIAGLRFQRQFCFVSQQGQEDGTALNFIHFVFRYLQEHRIPGRIKGGTK
ncbi:LysR substrate-binding domain-containing protein [Bacteroides gallinaceum]|uniref:LysR substrate-binding domain-containing protein n=1 Tax=Bacteroides gallinaceum TaxID=1462571 RepID=A0ABT7X8L4_9BACE|nr:LysR substrate-binding domain-containing protein [Bacteroides gallinaceum]MDN0050424.1 LysR substrate-binding domain-containing protein [Bacteroides gallinaceum]